MSKIFNELNKAIQSSEPKALEDFLERLKVSTPWYGGRRLVLKDEKGSGSIAIRHIVTALLEKNAKVTKEVKDKIVDYNAKAEYELTHATGVAGWFKRFGTWWRRFANTFLGYNYNESINKLQVIPPSAAAPATQSEAETQRAPTPPLRATGAQPLDTPTSAPNTPETAEPELQLTPIRNLTPTITKEHLFFWAQDMLQKELADPVRCRTREEYLDEIVALGRDEPNEEVAKKKKETFEEICKILNELVKAYHSLSSNNYIKFTRKHSEISVELSVLGWKENPPHLPVCCNFGKMEPLNSRVVETYLSSVLPLSPLVMTAIVAGCFKSLSEDRKVLLDRPNHFMSSFKIILRGPPQLEKEQKAKTEPSPSPQNVARAPQPTPYPLGKTSDALNPQEKQDAIRHALNTYLFPENVQYRSLLAYADTMEKNAEKLAGSSELRDGFLSGKDRALIVFLRQTAKEMREKV